MSRQNEVQQAFLKRILENPREHTFKAMYADWCEEQDIEHERAEFIKLQLKGEEKTDKEWSRQRQLLLFYWTNIGWANKDKSSKPRYIFCYNAESSVIKRTNWLDVMCVEFINGFVSRIWLEGNAWLEHANNLQLTYPLTDVVLKTLPDFEHQNLTTIKVWLKGYPKNVYRVSEEEIKEATWDRMKGRIATKLLKDLWPHIDFIVEDNRYPSSTNPCGEIALPTSDYEPTSLDSRMFIGRIDG